MQLSEASIQDIAEELAERGSQFILIADHEGALEVYSPEKITGEADEVSGGLFRHVRDYLAFLEEQGFMET